MSGIEPRELPWQAGALPTKPPISLSLPLHLALPLGGGGGGDSHRVGHVKVGKKIPGLDDGAEFLPLFRQRIHTYHAMLSMEQAEIRYFTSQLLCHILN